MRVTVTFEAWKAAVDQIVWAKVGLGIDDLPDCCLADWHAEGVSPRSAASRAIRAAKEE